VHGGSPRAPERAMLVAQLVLFAPTAVFPAYIVGLLRTPSSEPAAHARPARHGRPCRCMRLAIRISDRASHAHERPSLFQHRERVQASIGEDGTRRCRNTWQSMPAGNPERGGACWDGWLPPGLSSHQRSSTVPRARQAWRGGWQLQGASSHRCLCLILASRPRTGATVRPRACFVQAAKAK
jgi:hypothetical protein